MRCACQLHTCGQPCAAMRRRMLRTAAWRRATRRLCERSMLFCGIKKKTAPAVRTPQAAAIPPPVLRARMRCACTMKPLHTCGPPCTATRCFCGVLIRTIDARPQAAAEAAPFRHNTPSTHAVSTTHAQLHKRSLRARAVCMYQATATHMRSAHAVLPGCCFCAVPAANCGACTADPSIPTGGRRAGGTKPGRTAGGGGTCTRPRR